MSGVHYRHRRVLLSGSDARFGAHAMLVAYDATGRMPTVLLHSPDGEIELRGIDEIRSASLALSEVTRLAETFGPVVTWPDWRQAHAQ